MDNARTIHGVVVLELPGDGAILKTERQVLDLIGDAHSSGAQMVALPVVRLGDDFFTLRTRLAGAMLQKFMNYGIRVAIVGDIAHHIRASEALGAFVRESNRGRHVWFVADQDALAERLKQGE